MLGAFLYHGWIHSVIIGIAETASGLHRGHAVLAAGGWESGLPGHPSVAPETIRECLKGQVTGAAGK